MNRVDFRLDGRGYALLRDGAELACMEGGPGVLLAGAGGQLREADIEAAIERAEDWLMPSSRSWRGLPLFVQDLRGDLRRHLGAPEELALDEVERAFSHAVEDVARGRSIAREVLADLVLLRELAHHGAVPKVVFG